MRYLVKFLQSDDGATAVEYAVMLALILIAIIGSIGSLGSETGGMWGGIQTNLRNVGFIK